MAFTGLVVTTHLRNKIENRYYQRALLGTGISEGVLALLVASVAILILIQTISIPGINFSDATTAVIVAGSIGGINLVSLFIHVILRCKPKEDLLDDIGPTPSKSSQQEKNVSESESEQSSVDDNVLKPCEIEEHLERIRTEKKKISVCKVIATTNTTDPTNPNIAPKKMPEGVKQHDVFDTERPNQNSPTTIPLQNTNEKESKSSTQLNNEREAKPEERIKVPSSAPPAELDDKEKEVQREDALPLNPLPPIQTKLVATVDQELEKQRILEVYGQQMVDALGGAEKIMGFPVLNKPPSADITTFPAGHFVRGESDFGPFLSFCYKTYYDDFESYIYPKHECWIRDKEAKTWRIVQTGISNFLSPKVDQELADDSIATKVLIDRIRRLASGEPIGRLKRLSPKQLITNFIPYDAYLTFDELVEYMKLGISYEINPKQYSEIISWDPTQSTEFNRERLKTEHPDQKLMCDNIAWPRLRK